MPYTAEDCSPLCWPAGANGIPVGDYTADDCAESCWPYGGGPSSNPADHERCEADLMDFSDPAKRWAYCACDCHYREGLPGFEARTAGRFVTREQDPANARPHRSGNST